MINNCDQSGPGEGYPRAYFKRKSDHGLAAVDALANPAHPAAVEIREQFIGMIVGGNQGAQLTRDRLQEAWPRY